MDSVKKTSEQEPGSRRANRTVKQLYVDIEEGFREAVRGFQAFQFVVQEDDGWVKRLRDNSLAQSRLNRAVKAHREAAHLFCAIRPYHPWTATEHALLVDLYERSDTFLRDLGLVHFKAQCEFSSSPPEVVKLRGRHIWHAVKPYPRVRNAAVQCGGADLAASSTDSDEGTPTEDEPPLKRTK
jgi:hypothetical protein